MLCQTFVLLLVTLSSPTHVKPDIDFQTTSHVTGSRATVSTGRDKCPTVSVCSSVSIVLLVTQIRILCYTVNRLAHCPIITFTARNLTGLKVQLCCTVSCNLNYCLSQEIERHRLKLSRLEL